MLRETTPLAWAGWPWRERVAQLRHQADQAELVGDAEYADWLRSEAESVESESNGYQGLVETLQG